MTPAQASTTTVNRLELLATLAQRAAVRYTPAGIPALDVLLEHRSAQQEAGQVRQVVLRLKGVVFGVDADRLANQTLGSTLWCVGFLTSAHRGHGVVFHIQDFKPI